MSRFSRRFGRILAMVAVGAVALTGCATDSGSDEASASSSSANGEVVRGVIGDQGDGGEPVKGGTLTFASLAPVTNLDPTLTQATGPTGGTEMAAVYDVLMRYDIESE